MCWRAGSGTAAPLQQDVSIAGCPQSRPLHQSTLLRLDRCPFESASDTAASTPDKKYVIRHMHLQSFQPSLDCNEGCGR